MRITQQRPEPCHTLVASCGASLFKSVATLNPNLAVFTLVTRGRRTRRHALHSREGHLASLRTTGTSSGFRIGDAWLCLDVSVKI